MQYMYYYYVLRRHEGGQGVFHLTDTETRVLYCFTTVHLFFSL